MITTHNDGVYYKHNHIYNHEKTTDHFLTIMTMLITNVFMNMTTNAITPSLPND